jgi:hypothetical protein
MNCIGVTGVAVAIAVSFFLGCSSSDTVVAANVQSSNDNQYNPTTANGRRGGLLDPGIEDGILNRASATPTVIRVATQVRLTISQDGQAPIEHLTVPAVTAWTSNKVDSAGNPVMDDAGVTLTETHKSIGPYYDRFILPDSWKGGEATLKAEAVDATGVAVLSATVSFSVVEQEPVYVPVDLRLPDDPAFADGGVAEGGDAGDTDDASAPRDASEGGSPRDVQDASAGGS